MAKILVIDDDELLRGTILQALSQKGHQTIGARNGREGIAMAYQDKPDLILSDLQMDEQDGYAVLEQLRKTPETAAIPFILMTGEDYPKDLRKGMELSADAYLIKPFTLEELLESIDAKVPSPS